MLRNTIESWGAPAKVFHWLIAALILSQIALGLTAAGWHLSPTKLNLFVWHKSIGMLILALVV
ncbi:MAG TPA: cytochrome b/b6 domain-containing protein, partial [Burkholderiales bacterium]|nr:cytochrome b/b6 domain-containing protein [Burkholderiales bacterium]